jgi:methylmalonyl-CoA/ethylmalonyl-CoA epimerase
VILSTPNITGTTVKWADVLGLHPSEITVPEGTHMRLAKLPAGNAFVELAQPLTDDHRIARSIAERGPGMFSISVRVNDLLAAVGDLRAKGVPVSEPEPGVWPQTRVARINKSATNGVSIQLIERSDIG